MGLGLKPLSGRIYAVGGRERFRAQGLGRVVEASFFFAILNGWGDVSSVVSWPFWGHLVIHT